MTLNSIVSNKKLFFRIFSKKLDDFDFYSLGSNITVSIEIDRN